jgi:hypothetical protein
MRQIKVYRSHQPSLDTIYQVIDSTLSEPKLLGIIEFTTGELLTFNMFETFKRELKTKIYDLVVSELGEDIEYTLDMRL